MVLRRPHHLHAELTDSLAELATEHVARMMRTPHSSALKLSVRGATMPSEKRPLVGGAGKWAACRQGDATMDVTQPTTFGALLRRSRIAAGWTQAELAERTNVSVRGISDMERGVTRWPHRDTVALLAETLQFSETDRAVFIAAARRPLAGERSTRPLSATSASLRNLPIPPTPIIGRAREEAAAVHLLRSQDVRMLTLTGAPGVGKTRLALQVARALSPDFAGDVAFVALAEVRDAGQVIPAIAHALGLRETNARSTGEALLAALRSRAILLALDNFEQVLGAATELAELLATCPRLKLLVTSRAPLRLRAEHEFAVTPLAVPDLTQTARLEDVSQRVSGFAAVALFTQRARAVSPAFTLAAANARAIAMICARLDGLPLAIELAAARIKYFSPSALLERLDRRLPTLAGGAHDLPERQRTLERAIDWSHDLLDERERRLFRRLAVFVGGWTLAAAESVCATESDPRESRAEIMVGLISLVDKSLVVREEDGEGEARFRMLETIHEYALERLADSDEEEAIRERHFDYCLGFTEAAMEELRGPAQATWLDRLERDYDNVRAAMAWALARGEAEHGLRMTFSLFYFFRKRGRLREGQRWMQTFLALLPDVAPSASEPDATSSVTARASLALRAKGLFALAALRLWQSDQGGVAQLEEGIALSRQVGDIVMTADALHARGMVAFELGDQARGEALLEEGLALSRVAGHPWSVAQALWTLGEIAYARDDFAQAERLNAESLALFRQVGDVSYIAMLTLREGYLAQARGDLARAAVSYREALALGRSLGETRAIVESLEALAKLLCDCQRYEQAVYSLSVATHLREVTAEPPRPSLQPILSGVIATLRANLGADGFVAAWAKGQAMSLDQVSEDIARDSANATP